MLFRKSKREILCIDWDERSVRILETAFQRTGAVVRRAVLAPVPEGLDVRDPSVLGDFLRRTLGEHRIRCRRAIVDVPRQDTVLNRLSLPAGTMDELAAMVHLQIAKELPFSKDQAVIDFAVVPKDGATTWDVWVAAIRNNVLEYYRQVFAAAGLTLDRIGLRPYANVRLMQASEELTQGRVVMVDIGPTMTEINILRDGQLMYTRAAPVAVPVEFGNGESGNGDASTAIAGDWPMDNLLIEVSRTIAAYRATDLGSMIDRILLSGTGVNERLLQTVEERFSVPTQLPSMPQAIRWKAELATSPTPFAAAIGLALSNLGENAQRFDFLHVKEPEAEHRQRVKRRPVMAATAAMFAAAIVVVAYQPIRNRNCQLESVESNIRLINADQKSRDEALKRIADLNSWQDSDVIWIDYLKKIAAVFPSNKDCFITKFEANSSKGEITLHLAAADRFVAAKVVEAIQDVVDQKGHPIFEARAGNKAGEYRLQGYPISDEVTVTVVSVAPQPKKKKR